PLPPNNVHVDAGNCGSGPTTTADGINCADCPDNPNTPGSEAGACFDINGDGVPDMPSLVPNLVTITCAGTNFSWSNGDTTCTRVTARGTLSRVLPAEACDGFYAPAGNRIATIDNGYAGLGPRLLFYPAFGGTPFPADNDCELTVATTITDHDGLGLTAPSPA